ncbi:hypothetical protein CH337_19770 [Rhodoblastus acidophilus]|nr:EAL domain-containing protein [Rhodoblastus acidophilus]PPQ36123.1 hypothetical protein CKO16_18765 [Rhodoblastus acidophilus]RAI16749.1 hypothetical protein CH337_19770 [Rhodoblastus acidophilus]
MAISRVYKIRWTGSIHAKMTLVIFGFFALVASVSSAGIFGLWTMDEKLKSIERTGLVEVHFFGELADKVSELRLIEMSISRAESKAERAESLVLLAERRAQVGQLMAQIDAIMQGRADARLLDRFRVAWRNYAERHDSQFAGADSQGETGGLHGPLHRAYADTEAALDALSDDSQNRIDQEVQAANAMSRSIMTMMVAAAAIVSLAALFLYARARAAIFAPLRQITAALTALAQGRTDIDLPVRKARDEIAALADAFRVFRDNLAELEGAHRDAEIARKGAEAMALTDPLTNLPNRRALAAKLRAIGEGRGEAETSCALLIVDLDRFKPVNDLLGHMVGDLVLCAVSERLEQVVPRGGMVARLGGDEFAVVMSFAGRANVDAARELADAIVAALRAPIAVVDHRVEIGASVGIALSQGEIDPVALLSSGDIAMYRAKKRQPGPVCQFEPEMEGELRRLVGLEKALRRALASGEITPHYQPVVDLATRRLRGFELLARWRDRELGEVSPEIFIPLAEQQGLIVELSQAMLAQACRDAALWPEDVVLSINLSPAQLRDRRFPEDLLAQLRAAGFPPQRLEVEITETALIGDVDLVRDILVRLRAAGMTVALDDFGMGFSSLNHLRQFKIDKVKIDKSFTKTIFEDSESALIVRSVIHLARGLNLMVVAEGIEDARTAEMMNRMGCDFGQGYHFGKALAATDAARLIAPLAAAGAAA